MIKTPLCGTAEGIAGATVTIFVGLDSCFGSVIMTNYGAGAVDIFKNGSSTSFVTLSPGSRLALSLDSLLKLELTFVVDSVVSYKGCICCNAQCCEPSCEI